MLYDLSLNLLPVFLSQFCSWNPSDPVPCIAKLGENSIALFAYCGCAWTLTAVCFFNFWVSLQKGIAYIKRLHEIPCHACEFFTNDYRLKCTVRPMVASTEEAIACPDFQPKTRCCNACRKPRHKAWLIPRQLAGTRASLPQVFSFFRRQLTS